MATPTVKSEHMLQGSSNFAAWKARSLNTFVEFDLDDIVTRKREETTAVTTRAAYRKKQANSKRLIFESIKDSKMPLVQSLPTAKECMDTLSKLYDVDAPSLKRSLKKELFTMKMEKNEIVASFFSRITQLKEQLYAIAAMTKLDDFIGAAIDGLPDSWSSFIGSVSGRSKS